MLGAAECPAASVAQQEQEAADKSAVLRVLDSVRSMFGPLESIRDTSLGCDQRVFIVRLCKPWVKLTRAGKPHPLHPPSGVQDVVVKVPCREPVKVWHEVYSLRLCVGLRIPVPRMLHVHEAPRKRRTGSRTASGASGASGAGGSGGAGGAGGDSASDGHSGAESASDSPVLGAAARATASPPVYPDSVTPFLVQTVAPGTLFSEVEPGMSSLSRCQVYFHLGQLMRRLHSRHVPGFGYIDRNGVGCSPTHQDASNLDKDLRALFATEALTPRQQGEVASFLAQHRHLASVCPSVVLHGDIAPTNMFIHHRPKGNSEVSCLIDWGDLWAGSPYEDFAVLFALLYDTEQVSAMCLCPLPLPLLRVCVACLSPPDPHLPSMMFNTPLASWCDVRAAHVLLFCFVMAVGRLARRLWTSGPGQPAFLRRHTPCMALDRWRRCLAQTGNV